MAQTTVNQYFVARKSQSHALIHPSKKRKVDICDLEANIVSKKKISREVKVTTRTRSQRKNDNKKLPAEPEPLSIRNQKPPGTPEKTLHAIGSVIKSSPLGKVRINDAINDQAKTILHSRGNSILQSSLQGKSATSPAKASEVLLSMSPKKAESLKELTVISSEESNLQRRKDMLRHKYSNLLKDEPANVKVKAEALPDTSSRHKRTSLRDKYKHLLVKESSLSSSSESASVSVKPNSSLGKTMTSPQKAFEKYKHLTEKNVTTTFQLPQKYKLLLEMFRCADSVLFLLHQRSETCTFERLKKSVQSMCGRDFEMKHLANMKTVYPNGFIFRQEKGLYTSSGSAGKTNSYQLTIEANYMDLQVPKQSIKNNSSILITRRLKFENRLLEITKSHHQKYLRKLNLKIDDKEIHRWHPHFKLEEVPDIPASNLPIPPIVKSCSSAADLLLSNQHFSSKVANALQNASEQNKNSNSQSSATSTISSTSTTSTTNSATKTTQNSRLKGVSADLLERIRQKEQKKIELEMTRNPKQELRLSRMERLPDISRIIKTYFVAEKKAAITLEDCVQKLSESYGTDLHSSNLEEHIRLLADIVPKWLQILPVRKCMYVKIAKNLDINIVLNTLADVKKREETKS